MKTIPSQLRNLALTTSFFAAANFSTIPVQALEFNLTDGNSTAHFSDITGGFDQWLVDNVDHLRNPDVFGIPGLLTTIIRTNEPGICENGDPILIFAQSSCFVLDENNSTIPTESNPSNEAQLTYNIRVGENTVAIVVIDYSLIYTTDGTTSTAALTQQIQLTNTSGGTRDYDFFQYYNLNLNESAENNQVGMAGGTDPDTLGDATQTYPYPGSTITTANTTTTEGDMNESLNYYDASQGDLLGTIIGLGATGDLAEGKNQPPTPVIGLTGPDVDYAYQFSTPGVLNGNTVKYQQVTTIIAQIQTEAVVNEPTATIAFLGLGTLFLAHQARKRYHNSIDS